MKTIGIYLERKPNSGGAYQYCLAMLKALSQCPKSEYNIIAFCTYEEWKNITEPLGIFTKVVKKNIFQKIIHYVAERGLSVEAYRRHCRLLHPLPHVFEQLSVDACIYPCGDKISFMLDTPAIITMFDVMHRYLVDFPELVGESAYKNRERSNTNIVKYAFMIFSDCQVGKEQIVECYGQDDELKEKLEKNIRVLPMIAPDYVYESIGQNKYPMPDDIFGKYIFYPAQFWKHKNHKNLLLAIAELKKRGIVINVVFCGAQKNGYEEVIQIIEENHLEDQVKILGYVTNEMMVALYQNARALVMTSHGGPTNIPQLEAFVLGCPVATSRIFGIPDQVGDAALLFDPKSVSEIEDCVEKLWLDDDMCNELIKRGYEKAEEWGELQFKNRLLELLSLME